MNNCKHFSIDQRRELLNSFGGKFYSITWIKKDNSVRSCTARHMQHNMFAEGHASLANESTVVHKKELYTCVDVSNNKWVNVSLDKLISVKCGDKEIEF